MTKKLSLILGIFGAVTLLISEILLFNKIEPVYTWFYSFAWWSYILIVDSIVYHRTGRSLIWSRSAEFARMIPWSIAFWLFFEMVNLNLTNWHYLDLPRIRWVRWAGYAAAYATVLPGIFETRDLLDALGLWKEHRVTPVSVTRMMRVVCMVLGIAGLFLPLMFPRYCFPLIWGSFIFLCEPILYTMTGRSLLRQWENGSVREILLLLSAGFICGGLWEFWNFWAKAQWVYTVPWVGHIKIFEMPVLGFFGFPPFAVSLYCMWQTVLLLQAKKYLPSTKLMLPAFCIMYYICFQAIDLFTVHSFK